MKTSKIIIATKNEGKVREFSQIFNKMGLGSRVSVSSLLDFGDLPDIIEDGKTFSENALIKVRAVAEMKGIYTGVAIVIADDSGLEVDALGGRPGVNSARYAGLGATDEQNNTKLLNELSGVKEGERQANFTSAIAVMCLGPMKKEDVVVGHCPGTITMAPTGEKGFGYDPIFYYPPLKKTFAQMDDVQKNEISHRRIAIEKLVGILPDFLEQ